MQPTGNLLDGRKGMLENLGEKKKKNIIEINRVICLIPFLTYDTERCSSAAVLAVGLACLCFDRTDEEVQLC